jgi:hypothetical protein
VLGAVGGSVVGDRIEGSGEPELRTVRQCGTQTTYENRPVAYNVVYEFAGKQYSAQMPHDPGPTLALQIGPVGAVSSEPPRQTYPADIPVYEEPLPVVVTQPTYPAYPVYPVYYTRPYYPPAMLNFGFGYWGGDYRDHHRHWR